MSNELEVFDRMCIATKTADEAWQLWFRNFRQQAEQGKEEQSRDGEIVAEAINSTTIIADPTRNIVKSEDRKMPMRYAVGELLWYLSGSDRLEDIRKFSTVWDRMSDDGETVNSAYGNRIFNKFGFNQLSYVLKTLSKNPESRQAVVHIKDPVDYTEHSTKDVPCTVALQYLVRNGKLYASTFMRSNDLWMGFPYDVFSFTSIQMILAFQLGLDIGSYTHFVGSLHLYKRDYETWKKRNSEV